MDQVSQNADLKIDRRAMTIADDFDDAETTRWWHLQNWQSRLEHVMALRRLNYGDAATARLQRVLEIIERP